MPSAENSYRNLILNQRVNMVNPFVSREVWESCSGQGGDFVGEVYLGLDLSVRNDLTALIAVGKDQDGLWTVQPPFFAPLNGIDERSRRDRTPYDMWMKQGWLDVKNGRTELRRDREEGGSKCRFCGWT